MKTFIALLCMAIAVGFVSEGWSDDYIHIESRNVVAGSANATVKIQISNSDTLMGIVLPLELRPVTPGAFVKSVSLGFRERLLAALGDVRITNQYGLKDGLCAEGRTASYGIPLANVCDSSVHIVAIPVGVMYGAFRTTLNHALPPGEDSLGSLELSLSVTSTSGDFEIDTVCVGPNHHVSFVVSNLSGFAYAVIPAFTKGIITIVQCDCSHHGDMDGDEQITSLDLGLLIDYIFASGDAPPTDASCPHIDRGDVDCTGSDDASDVARMVDILFAAGSACDPCDCDPYPGSCP
jgi:hypothetical protein